MKPLEVLIRRGRRLRVIGFDDAPFERVEGAPVSIAGVICSGTRFEGMLWGQATRDGDDATSVVSKMLLESRFLPQVHLVLLDGLGVGGFNLYDLPLLASLVERPCVAVMRKQPDLEAINGALGRFSDADRRRELIRRAGPIYAEGGFVFQVAGASAKVVGQALGLVTDRGHVPECLRLAHLIGGAVKTGSSGRRA